ncbi:MAG: hypothetical protein CVV50_00080 [Spirochaetae bacterium HGW-Spirochaetae-6]|nr:MAG: hypothetical protein CVV50_00080 [Spirochaetae bacterium HGW-Spirochaetae-6]
MEQTINGERQYKRGKILLKRAKFKTAKNYFESAISLNYYPSLCFLHIGIIQLYESEYSEAFKNFQMVLTSDEKVGDVYYYIGKIFQAFDNQEEAYSNFKKAVYHSREEIIRLLALEELENVVSQTEFLKMKSLAYNSYLIRTEISQDDNLLRQAIIARIDQNFVLATQKLEEYTSLFPDYFLGYYELSRTFTRMRQSHKAYHTLKKLRSTFKKEKFILKELAKASFRLRKFKESIFFIKKLIKYNPKSAKLYVNLATCLTFLGKDNEAIRYYKKGIELSNNFFTCYYNVGVIYQKNGFLEEALENYTTALNLKPDYAPLNYNLGLIYFEIQDYFQSLFYFSKAYSLDPSLEEAQNNFEVIRNLKTIENNRIKSEMNLASKVSLALSAIMLLLSFFYLVKG